MKSSKKVSPYGYMHRAIDLARNGMGRVHPNPMVGAVLVKNNRVIGEGFHAFYGGPHAEVAAIRSARGSVAGATMYVTLEPCNHYGKTPPCTELIVQSGIRKVIIGGRDPNRLVAGKGIARLKAAGLEVTTGCLRPQCEAINRDYNYWTLTRMPYVVLKIAQTLDGKIATAGGDSRWITGEHSRATGHAMRAQADAILVGVGTALRDNPLLNVRLRAFKDRRPQKIVLDSRLRCRPNMRMFSKISPGKNIIVTSSRLALNRRHPLAGKAELLGCPLQGGRIALKPLLKILGARGIVRLLVEGGSEVAASFLKRRLVNEVAFFIAPMILGGTDAKSAIGGTSPKRIKDSIRLRNTIMYPSAGDFVVEGYLDTDV